MFILTDFIATYARHAVSATLRQIRRLRLTSGEIRRPDYVGIFFSFNNAQFTRKFADFSHLENDQTASRNSSIVSCVWRARAESRPLLLSLCKGASSLRPVQNWGREKSTRTYVIVRCTFCTVLTHGITFPLWI